MFRGSITIKVFALLMAVFIIFVTIALYLQTAFFENYYINRKADVLDRNMEGFLMLYSEMGWREREIRLNTIAFERANGVRVAIVDEQIKILNEEKYALVVRDYSGAEISVDLNAALKDEEFSKISAVQPGQVVYAEGFLMGLASDLHMSPVRLIIDDETIIDYKSIYGYEGHNDTLDKIGGRIISADLPTEEVIIRGVEEHVLWAVVDYWNSHYNLEAPADTKERKSELTKAEKVSSFVFSEPITKDRYLTRVYTVQMGDVQHHIFVVSSKLPILEAVETLSSYYAIVVLAAVVMCTFLSFVVSLLVTRPLIRINNIASRMANLDFGDYIEVRTDDEIGHLSQSLNSLSMNLQDNMEALKKTNVQLQREIEKERKLEKMRRNFISGASHELKTPIGIIKGFSEGLRDGIAEPRQGYFIDVILEETDKLDALVQDMLELSKIEYGTSSLNMSHFEAIGMIRSTCEKLRPQVAERGRTLDIRSDMNSVMVYADQRRMEQVLSNGLNNAMRYSKPESNILLSIAEKPETIRISIENEGETIAKSHLAHIWDRFYRVDPSRNKESGGSGLGLSIVREILVQHKVAFDIVNTESGVMFYFEIKKSIHP